MIERLDEEHYKGGTHGKPILFITSLVRLNHFHLKIVFFLLVEGAAPPNSKIVDRPRRSSKRDRAVKQILKF